MAPKKKLKKNNKIEKYPISKEDTQILLESIALRELRDKYTRKWGGYKNAKKAAIEAVKIELKFWNRVRDLYPGLEKEQDADPSIIGLTFNRTDNTIRFLRINAPAN